ncbi:MAG: type II toxin-antitoxin system RelE/ParE family toxin [Nostocoides sp.]
MTSRSLRVHPEFLDDLRDAIDYYRSQDDPILPERFVDAYAEALTHVEEHPLTGREYLPGYRRVVAIPFPYLLAYAVDDESVYVAALLHANRNPETNARILRSRA